MSYNYLRISTSRRSSSPVPSGGMTPFAAAASKARLSVDSTDSSAEVPVLLFGPVRNSTIWSSIRQLTNSFVHAIRSSPNSSVDFTFDDLTALSLHLLDSSASAHTVMCDGTTTPIESILYLWCPTLVLEPSLKTRTNAKEEILGEMLIILQGKLLTALDFNLDNFLHSLMQFIGKATNPSTRDEYEQCPIGSFFVNHPTVFTDIYNKDHFPNRHECYYFHLNLLAAFFSAVAASFAWISSYEQRSYVTMCKQNGPPSLDDAVKDLAAVSSFASPASSRPKVANPNPDDLDQDQPSLDRDARHFASLYTQGQGHEQYPSRHSEADVLGAVRAEFESRANNVGKVSAYGHTRDASSYPSGNPYTVNHPPPPVKPRVPKVPVDPENPPHSQLTPSQTETTELLKIMKHFIEDQSKKEAATAEVISKLQSAVAQTMSARQPVNGPGVEFHPTRSSVPLAYCLPRLQIGPLLRLRR